MTPLDPVLLLATFTLGYVHLGYPAIVGALAAWRRPPPLRRETDALPRVALVIAAWQEEAVIAAKLEDCLALDYPAHLLRIVVVADGSTDRTVERAREFSGVEVLFQPARRGKLAAMARAVAAIDEPIVVATDANTLLEPQSLRRLVAHFADPRVGAVSGEKRVIARADGGGVVGEGAYWRYESFIKRAESACGSVVGAAGELYAFRRALWSTPPTDTILDDFVVSMQIVAAGYRNVYEPGAVATETASVTAADEAERRTRIAAGGWQAMARHPGWLHPRLGFSAFAYLSHRVLRWTLAPVLLFALPLLALAATAHGSAFGALVLLGCFLLFFLAWLPVRSRATTVAHHAVLAHAAALRGAWRWARKGQPVTWARVAR